MLWNKLYKQYDHEHWTNLQTIRSMEYIKQNILYNMYIPCTNE